MIKLNINLKERSYPIYVTNNFVGIGKCMAALKAEGKVAVITDTNVAKIYLQPCMDILKEAGYDAYSFVIEAGEEHKNLDTVKDIYRFLIKSKFDRKSSLLALGGGVTGDITGFVAATFLRGINFIQLPTTLLAQVDSSVGGKTGIDFDGSKNMVGAFYQPRLVYINVATLKSLPERQLRSGMAEVVKHGIIADAEFYEYVDYNVNRILKREEDVLQYMVKANCSIKGKIVEEDEKESGLRSILNFGHTIGHAIESVSNFSLLHGECVSVGMAGAFRIAKKLGLVDDSLIERVEETLGKIGLPVKVSGLDAREVYEQMFHDKKVRQGKLLFVLPKRIGEVIQCFIDDEGLIMDVLGEIIR